MLGCPCGGSAEARASGPALGRCLRPRRRLVPFPRAVRLLVLSAVQVPARFSAQRSSHVAGCPVNPGRVLPSWSRLPSLRSLTSLIAGRAEFRLFVLCYLPDLGNALLRVLPWSPPFLGL